MHACQVVDVLSCRSDARSLRLVRRYLCWLLQFVEPGMLHSVRRRDRQSAGEDTWEMTNVLKELALLVGSRRDH